MASKKKDASSFEGNGISFKAKLIGIEDVTEARGDHLCQETITRLKNSVKISGQHKQKVFINVTLEGLKIIDAISLTAANQNKKKSDTGNSKTSVDSEEAAKTDDMLVLHTHPVHKISFISRDTTDNRAFGYIIGSGEGKHTFFAIKTAAAAEQLVLTLRDLFQVVYEMKKKEMAEAKDKLEESNAVTVQEDTATENEKPSGEGSTSEEGQTQTQNGTQAADGDGIYHVPSNNARKQSIAEQQANLLDLEDQADSILKGIEQIKNLDFDSITPDGDKCPGSAMSPPPFQAPGTADPWGAPAAATTAKSNLGDLAGIQTGPFVNMQQPFPGGAFPGQMPGYNVAAVPGMRMANSGLPVTRDPFGTDPFTANFQQLGMRPAGFATPGYGGVANPFGAPAFGQQAFPGVRPPVPGMAPPAGMFPVSPPAANQNPFANFNAPEDPNMLKPVRTDQQGQEAIQDQEKAGSKSPREDLFGDLLGIKKTTSDAISPKDMFAQLNAADKKSMNEMKNPAEMPQQASFDNMDPFMDTGSVSDDKRRGLIASEGEDPFDTSHIPSLQAVHKSTTPFSSSTNVPPVPQRLSPAQNHLAKDKSHEKSSSSFSSISSNQAPLLAPPPPPTRVRTSPTLPPLICKKDTDVSIHSDHLPFVLPSPDEPPPPLPQDFIKSPAAPPPPPRPSSNSLSSVSFNNQSSAESSPSLKTKQSQSSLQTGNSSDLSFSPFSDQKTPTSKSKNGRNILKFDLTFNGGVSNDPFSIPLKSSSNNEASKNNKHNNNNHTNKLSHTSNNDSTSTWESVGKHSSLVSNSAKPVIFNPSPKTDGSKEGFETDPFGLPLNLTPGFKAVARFGNDPFEDSFGAYTNSSEQDSANWDPFPDTPSPFDNFTTSRLSSNDPWNTNASPFGDAFGAQPPATNNNPSTGTLLD